jgi:hypothetical protein
MAQVLAVPGDRCHGFDLKSSFSHDFGRITGIAVTNENKVLLCDYIKNQLLLFDEEGNYLSYLPLTGRPWDVAISNQNKHCICYHANRAMHITSRSRKNIHLLKNSIQRF